MKLWEGVRWICRSGASPKEGRRPARPYTIRAFRWALAGLLGWCLVQPRLLWGQENTAPETPPASEAGQTTDPSPLKDLQWNGHVAVSYNHNLNGHVNTFRVFDEGTRQVTLHQAEFWVEKPSRTESPLGFSVDVVLGFDAKKVHAAGLGSADDTFDLTQAYITYKISVGTGLDLKVGKFVTLHGAEVIRRSGNFNVSRSILFGYAIPFTHTGLMVTYPFTDRWTVTLGVINGWDNVTDNNSGKSLHGMVTVLPLKDLTLTVSGTWGPEQTNTNGPKRSLIDVVATYKPVPPLTLTVNFNYGVEADAVPDETGGLKTARWYGAAGYVLYDLDDRWSVGLRGEFFIDREGFRLGWTDPDTGAPGRLDLWELTGTVRYKVVDHLLASLEYRHDFASRPVFDGGAEGRKKSQGTVLVELVYLLK